MLLSRFRFFSRGRWTMARLPVVCDHCGELFKSRVLNVEITYLTLAKNRETCPHCGRQTGLLEGRVNVADGNITFLDGPTIPVEKLEQIRFIIEPAVDASEEDLDREIAEATGEQNFIERMANWLEQAGLIIDVPGKNRGIRAGTATEPSSSPSAPRSGSPRSPPHRVSHVLWFLNEVRELLG